jgi:hypothetical protein
MYVLSAICPIVKEATTGAEGEVHLYKSSIAAHASVLELNHSVLH